MKRVRVPRQDIARVAATMTGRGTSLKAHHLVGAHLKAWQIDVEHLLCRRVAGQHADQSRGNRLVRRLHLEKHRAGSAGRDATGLAVQQLAEACGAKCDSEIGFGIVKFAWSGAVLPCRDLFEQPPAQDRCVERTAIEQDSVHAWAVPEEVGQMVRHGAVGSVG